MGSKVILCIRPEFIYLKGDKVYEKQNIISGQIGDLIFIGDAYEGEIRVGKERLMIRIASESSLQKGDKVNFVVSAEHCLLVLD